MLSSSPPVFDDLPILNTDDVNTREFYFLSAGRKTPEIARVGAGHCDARCDLISFCDQLIDYRMPVGHAEQGLLVDLLCAFQACGHPGHHLWHRQVFRQDFPEGVQVVAVVNLLVAAYDRLVLFD